MQNGGLKPPEIFKFQLLLVGFNPCETSSSSGSFLYCKDFEHLSSTFPNFIDSMILDKARQMCSTRACFLLAYFAV